MNIQLNTQNMRQNLLGSLEIVLFMRRGAKRFAVTKKSMQASFLIPFMLLPLTLAMALYAHPDSALNATTMKVLVAVYSLRLVLYLAAFMGFVYVMARTLDKLDDFRHFMTMNNWLMLPIAALMILPIILSLNGVYTWSEVYPFIVLCMLYSCACTAFMATCVMRIPYELAIFIAITGMAIHQEALGFMKWAAVNTLYFLA